MRIAYIAYWNIDAGDGVSKKIESQLAHWRAQGHEAEPFVAPSGSLRHHLRNTVRAVREARAFEPDLVYLRYGFFMLPNGHLLRTVPTVLEINGDERAELLAHKPDTVRRTAKLLAHRLNRAHLLRRAAGIVCVTNELAALFAGYGKPTVVVANGADPDSVPWAPAPDNARPRAVFVGSPGMPWHGVDRLLDLARALPDVDFDLVGPDPHGELPNVTAHGVLAQADYFPLLGRADVAVGSLAMERAGLSEGCPLKVREYLLAGVPTVVGYDDTDFVGRDPWFLLKSIDPAEVRGFVERIRGRRVARDEVAHLTVEAKERERLAFLERLRVS